MSEALDLYDEISNPLDAVEDLFRSYEWSFDRFSNDKLSVQVTGQYDSYDVTMTWDELSNCLQFIACYRFPVEAENYSLAAEALLKINARLWLGHFVISQDNYLPALRHTCLFRGFFHSSGAEQIEDLIDIAIQEAEKFYPVFDWLAHKNVNDEKSPLDLVLMQSAGES